MAKKGSGKHKKDPGKKQKGACPQPTGKGKGKGKAAKAKPAPQPGRWLDRDCNAALNMQRIGKSRWRPLELCYWPDQGALPAKGKEYPGLGYKRLRDKPLKAQQQQQPAEAHLDPERREWRILTGHANFSARIETLSQAHLLLPGLLPCPPLQSVTFCHQTAPLQVDGIAGWERDRDCGLLLKTGSVHMLQQFQQVQQQQADLQVREQQVAQQHHQVQQQADLQLREQQVAQQKHQVQQQQADLQVREQQVAQQHYQVQLQQQLNRLQQQLEAQSGAELQCQVQQQLAAQQHLLQQQQADLLLKQQQVEKQPQEAAVQQAVSTNHPLPDHSTCSPQVPGSLRSPLFMRPRQDTTLAPMPRLHSVAHALRIPGLPYSEVVGAHQSLLLATAPPPPQPRPAQPARKLRRLVVGWSETASFGGPPSSAAVFLAATQMKLFLVSPRPSIAPRDACCIVALLASLLLGLIVRGFFARVTVLPDGQEAFEDIPAFKDRNLYLQLGRGLPPPGRRSRPSAAVEAVLAAYPDLHATLNDVPRYPHDKITVDDVGKKLETSFANSLTVLFLRKRWLWLGPGSSLAHRLGLPSDGGQPVERLPAQPRIPQPQSRADLRAGGAHKRSAVSVFFTRPKPAGPPDKLPRMGKEEGAVNPLAHLDADWLGCDPGKTNMATVAHEERYPFGAVKSVWHRSLTSAQYYRQSGITEHANESKVWMAGIMPQHDELSQVTNYTVSLQRYRQYAATVLTTWPAMWVELSKPRWSNARFRLSQCVSPCVPWLQTVRGARVRCNSAATGRPQALAYGAAGFSGSGTIGSRGVPVKQMQREACKQYPGRVVLVHEFRTSRVGSARTKVVQGQAESCRWPHPVRSTATRSRIRGLMCSTSNVIKRKFYDRDVSAALNIRRIAAGPGRPRELSSWLGRPAMPNPGRPGQEWVDVRDKGLLRKWQRRHQRHR
ncbi:hypothetical protein QJQ45_014645 [Haematococcus lacustris]|nr:hypothetical protein QJQ45_014645 [Haematococcus lacustris]